MRNHRTHFAKPQRDALREELLTMKLADQLDRLARCQSARKPIK